MPCVSVSGAITRRDTTLRRGAGGELSVGNVAANRADGILSITPPVWESISHSSASVY